MTAPPDYFFWQILLNVIYFAITTGLGVYVFVSNRNRAKAAELIQYQTATDKRIGEHSSRLSRVEETVRCMPNHTDIGNLHKRMDTMSEQLSEARGELKGIGKSVAMIHQFLLSQKKGSDAS
jgi:uncharacterized protein HemX